MSKRKICTECDSLVVPGKVRCYLHLFNPIPARKTIKEMKREAVRKHNEEFEKNKANPISLEELLRKAFLDVVRSVR